MSEVNDTRPVAEQWTPERVRALAGEPRKTAVDGAIAAFHIEDRLVQDAALDLLRALSPRAELVAALHARPLAVIPLIGALGARDDKAERRVVDDELMRATVALCRHDNGAIRAAAMLAMTRLPAPQADKEALFGRALANDPVAAVRTNAAIGLGRVGTETALASVRDAYRTETDRMVKVFLVDVLDAHGSVS